MLAPTNYNRQFACKLISSACVIWQGKTFNCIEVCKDNTIEDVVTSMGDKICELNNILSPINYDLSCFNFGNCPPSNFQQLFQYILNQLCLLMNEENNEETQQTLNVMVQLPQCLQYINEVGQPVYEMILYSVDGNDYMSLIGNKICDIYQQLNNHITQINNLQTQINNILNTIISQQVSLLPLNSNVPLFDHIVYQNVSQQYALVINQMMAYFAALNTIYDNASTSSPFDPNSVFNPNSLNSLYNSFIGNINKVCTTGTISISTNKNIVTALNNLWLYIQDIRQYLISQCSIDVCSTCIEVSEIKNLSTFSSVNTFNLFIKNPTQYNISCEIHVSDDAGVIVYTNSYSNTPGNIIDSFSLSPTKYAIVTISGCMYVPISQTEYYPCRFEYSYYVENYEYRCKNLTQEQITTSSIVYQQ